MYIEHHGKSTVKNLRTGDEAILEYHKMVKGLFGRSKNSGSVDGHIIDSYGNPHYAIKGTWNESLSICPVEDSKQKFDDMNSILIWKGNDIPENWERLYQFTNFTLNLNNLTNKMISYLPHTDTRYRPDQRALENGDLTQANSEKHRLEEKQRAVRKLREKQGLEWKPNYFEKYLDPDTNSTEYKFTYKYWEDRRMHNWDHLPDLFSKDN